MPICRIGLRELVAAGLQQDKPAVGLLRSGDDILIVAATAILPSSVAGEAVPVDERSTLIFAKTLNQDFLDRIGNEYLLKELRITPEGSALKGASIPLLGPGGNSLGRLAWSPETPGFELLRLLLPPLALALVILAAFAWLVVNNARKSASALEESARTVEAYAQTLQESEARFRDVAEASSDWIWETDPELRLTYLSGRFCEVTGIAAASVLGKTLSQFFTSDDPSESIGRTSLAAVGDAATLSRPALLLPRRDGHDAHLPPGRPPDRRSASGRVVGYRGTATDITRRGGGAGAGQPPGAARRADRAAEPRAASATA